MRGPIAILAACAVALLAAPSAVASFDIENFETSFLDADGSPVTQAGSHPFEMRTSFDVSSRPDAEYVEVPEGSTKDLIVELPAGLAGAPTSTPRCSGAEFIDIDPGSEKYPACSNATAVGRASVRIKLLTEISYFSAPVYNLVPPPGVAAKFGFVVLGAPVTIEASVNPRQPHNIVASVSNITQAVAFYGSLLSIWGTPSDPAHDNERGTCVGITDRSEVATEFVSRGSCPSTAARVPFLTMPSSCEGPLTTSYKADSWENPGVWLRGSSSTHDDSIPPNPLGLSGCSKLAFAPQLSATPTTTSAESPSGLDVDLEIDDEGIANPDGLAQSTMRKAVVTLPEGVTINPAQAEGLGVCGPAEYEASGPQWHEGCPSSSKVGTVAVQTPLLEGETLEGSVYVARPYENPYGSLIALYVVIRDSDLGVAVPLAGKVEPDPASGRLVSTFEELPQVPISRFRMHLREGGRSPLITPPACGEYRTEARFTPWSDPSASQLSVSTFRIGAGVGGGACPAAGPPPFHPGFEAGTLNNSAATHSAFHMRLTREDGDQDLTKLSTTLPPGVLASLAGVGRCTDAQIAQAQSRTGPHGGAEELAAPSCPAASLIGHTQTGAGVGGTLLYVPGSVYLAGPYHGAPLSVVAIVPGVAGPFDVGTIVVRVALRFDPRTAEAQADGSASDPIPHILRGIPLKVRDIRVAIDRPDWIFNPTSCDPLATEATLWGGGSDVFSTFDDSPTGLAARFQAAGCSRLGFKPRLGLRLRGGTKRGAHPALRGVYRPRAGDANLDKLVLRLPRSAFLDQAHIRTICTRVQYAAGPGNGARCPKGAVYGRATAYTPLLEEPLRGPVFLRSSNHNLPDFVASLHGLVDVEAVARIDSKNGGIRATFTRLPDAPLSRVVVEMQGGRKGLIVNSTGLCAARHRAAARYFAQSGRRAKGRPTLGAVKCAKKRRHRARGRHRAR